MKITGEKTNEDDNEFGKFCLAHAQLGKP